MGILFFILFELVRAAIYGIFYTALAFAALYLLAAIWDEIYRLIRKRRK